jgi:hypothetical protein
MVSSVRSWIDRHRLASFLLVTYGFTWTVQGLLAASGMAASWTLSILVGFGAFGPPIGAAVVVWAVGGDLRAWLSQVVRWRIGTQWWTVALLLPLSCSRS